jgi:hypothetical protein
MTLPFVKPAATTSFPSPLHRAFVGQMRQKDGQQFADYLIKSVLPHTLSDDDGNNIASLITLKKLLYNDISLGQLMTRGVDEAFVPIVVDQLCALVRDDNSGHAGSRGDKPPKTKKQTGSAGDAAAHSDGGFDFLNFGSDVVEEPKDHKPKKNKGPTQSANAVPKSLTPGSQMFTDDLRQQLLAATGMTFPMRDQAGADELDMDLDALTDEAERQLLKEIQETLKQGGATDETTHDDADVDSVDEHVAAVATRSQISSHVSLSSF